MNEAIQANVDLVMATQFQAERSSVTSERWHQTAPDCWVCAYARRAPTETTRPTLYMVHYYRKGPHDTMVVYRSLNDLEKEQVVKDAVAAAQRKVLDAHWLDR